MSSSEDSEVSYTDYEYVMIEAENDDDRDVSPPTNDDEENAFADESAGGSSQMTRWRTQSGQFNTKRKWKWKRNWNKS